jgi:hypothetical protein
MTEFKLIDERKALGAEYYRLRDECVRLIRQHPWPLYFFGALSAIILAGIITGPLAIPFWGFAAYSAYRLGQLIADRRDQRQSRRSLAASLSSIMANVMRLARRLPAA